MLIPTDIDFFSLLLFRTADGWQANCQVSGESSYRIGAGDTPDEAIAALFMPASGVIPPPPY